MAASAGEGSLTYYSAATRCTRHCVISARSDAGFTGLLSTMHAVGAGFLAHMARAVGGDQDRRDMTAEAAAQFGDGGNAVAAVEVIVDQKPVRLEAA